MSQNYFVRRSPPVNVSYEETYWGVITDPDGQVRDRRLERERYLEDLKIELSFINSLPIGRMLDIGCGLGFLLSGVASAWERHGVEVSEFAATHATQYANVFQGRLEEAGYPDGYFDLVVIYHVIEHVEQPEVLLQEIRRVLKPEGWLILGTPDFDSGAARRFGENYRMLHDVTHISLFSNESMHRFLRDHGFGIERVEYPYFETRYFNRETLLALLDTSGISPPFYGNFMTFYCRKGPLPALSEKLAALSAYLRDDGAALQLLLQECGQRLKVLLESGWPVYFRADSSTGWSVDLLTGRLVEQGFDVRREAFQTVGQVGVVSIIRSDAERLCIRIQPLGAEAVELLVPCPSEPLMQVLLCEALVDCMISDRSARAGA